MYTYQVEFQDDDDKIHVKPYGTNLAAARQHAARMSVKHMVAYVVSCKDLPDGGNVSVGHKSYGNGCVIETEGEGF